MAGARRAATMCGLLSVLLAFAAPSGALGDSEAIATAPAGDGTASRRLLQAPPSPSFPPVAAPPPPPGEWEGGSICPPTCACCINDRCTMEQEKCDEVRTIVLATVGGATFLAAVFICVCYRRQKAKRRKEREHNYTVTAAPGYEPGGTFT